MFAEFSGGYYLGRLFVQSEARSDAVLLEEQFNQLGGELYGEEWSGAPLIMRYNQRHYEVWGEQGIPSDTLVLPEECLNDVEPGRRQEVLLAKAAVERLLQPFAGPTDVDVPKVTRDPFVPEALRRTDRPG